MTLSDDLLHQAEALCSLDPRRPKEINLRRAVSAAYYAVFHQLTECGVQMLLPGRRGELRAQLRRKFKHGSMKTVAQATKSREELDAGIRFVADAFVQLQEARHDADYDFSRSFAKAEALDHIRLARDALERLEAARTTTDGERFLLEMLVGRLDP